MTRPELLDFLVLILLATGVVVLVNDGRKLMKKRQWKKHCNEAMHIVKEEK